MRNNEILNDKIKDFKYIFLNDDQVNIILSKVKLHLNSIFEKNNFENLLSKNKIIEDLCINLKFALKENNEKEFFNCPKNNTKEKISLQDENNKNNEVMLDEVKNIVNLNNSNADINEKTKLFLASNKNNFLRTVAKFEILNIQNPTKLIDQNYYIKMDKLKTKNILKKENISTKKSYEFFNK